MLHMILGKSTAMGYTAKHQPTGFPEKRSNIYP